ncbi:MAG TPA: FG-GAP-like repeat-containing protein [Verrucomicrobiae bacterium]|nr:FG-GAP-like repeat-containing protein [Verrucomicrobiae bacterium]
MKTILIVRILLACLLAGAATNLRAAEEQDLIATLQSAAAPSQKWQACQQLRVMGTAKAVPALSALLTDEKLSQAARFVLEALPSPEADAALRDALGRTSGRLKAGVVDSIGWRGQSASVPLLTPLLSDSNPDIASAAAEALGRIGGPDALAALSTAREHASPAALPALLESLLKSAERLAAANDTANALAVYQELFNSKYPVQVRTSAWRGVVLADAQHRTELVLKALGGADRPVQMVALKLLRQSRDRQLIEACAAQWASFSPESQLAVLDAQMKLGAAALPLARLASQSSDLRLRIAGLQGLGELSDLPSIPSLAKAAAQGEPSERDAARDGLERLRGPGASQALLARVEDAATPEKTELLRALGQRGDPSAVGVLLQNASSAEQPVRLAALDALSTLAPPEAAPRLLEMAAKSKSDDDRGPVLKALYAICEASPNKEESSDKIVEALGRFPLAERGPLLPILAELGTPEALAAAQAASRDADPELAREGLRVLAQWPNAAPAGLLLEISRASTDPTLQTLALRGAIQVAGQEPDPAKRLALLEQAMASASRLDEKKQALGELGQIPTPEALDIALKSLTIPGLTDEAALASLGIAEKLARANPTLAQEAATQVLARVKEGDIARRAWALRRKPRARAPFIRDWLVSGPYRQAGVVGATAIFDIAFPPENPGSKVEWKTVPPEDHVSLATLFPEQQNCAAYLRTRLIAPQDCQGLLLVGSDDGVKAWLNGKVVHSNNVDRGEVTDQDTAPISLKKGANELMLKITQGGGGWSAVARIVGTDFKPIRGLRVECPQGDGPAGQAAIVPKPAELPGRSPFRRVCLSNQFYAEGASYGDFNRDGHIDIVAGPFWFEGPDFKKRHEYRPAKAFDPKGYSDNFLTFTGDFNGDGWPDILCIPFPGAEGFWYENPAGKEGAWKKHLAYPKIGDESPTWGDINGDGHPELIFCIDGYLGYAGPDRTNPDAPWVFHPISTKENRYQKFTHGLGFGDINGDKRVDIIEAAGWWEQPAKLAPDQPWIFHPFHFADAGAQMMVYDVNGDGLADIITAWHCHHYGLVWWQQIKGADGQPDWKEHIILPPNPDVTTTDFRVSQMHAMALADMNGDGLMDIVTGKRFWAHGPNGDKEPAAPAVLFWMELRRDGKGGASFIPHLIDDDSGVGTQVIAADLNGDGRPDVLVANKKGIFIHFNEMTAGPRRAF